MNDGERLAVAETELAAVKSDLSEIKASVKRLEAMASRGGGAFNAILMIGGLIGWVAGIISVIYAMVRH